MIKLTDILFEIKVNKPFRYEKAYGESHSYDEYLQNKEKLQDNPDNFLIDLENKKIIASFTGWNVARWARLAEKDSNKEIYRLVSKTAITNPPPYLQTPHININDPNSWESSNIALSLIKKYSTNLDEIKVNKPFKPPTHFPIIVNKKEYSQVTEYLTKMGYEWTGETYTDFNEWNPWDNGGVEDEESKIYLFLKNKNIIYWGYVETARATGELTPTPIKNFNKIDENQQIQNINYYQQILDQSNGLSITQRQYFQKIINSIKKQNNKVTPRQHDLLQRIKSGNFTYSTKNEIKVNQPNSDIIKYPVKIENEKDLEKL